MIKAASQTSLFRIPKGIAEEIERMQRNILWNRKESSKSHLMLEDRVTTKKSRALPLGGIIRKNMALLGKRIWHFLRE